MKFLDISFMALLLIMLDCGGGGGGSTPPAPSPAPTISLSPQQPIIHVAESLQFVATVNNSADQSLVWSATAGGINAAGQFTAPANVALVTVTATLKTNSSIKGSATFNVLPAPPQSITISPSTVSLASGQSQQFSVTFNNLAAPSPGWSAFLTQDQLGSFAEFTSDGHPLCGTITGAGLYTAPLASGQYSVMVADSNHPAVPVSVAHLTVNGWGPIQGSARDLPYRPYASFNLLQDSTVLIAGGEADAKSAMIYDPSSNSIVRTIPMTANRCQHTATVLQDGSIFMAGGGSIGMGTSSILSTTEIYDPVTQSFKAGPALPRPTFAHQSILLEDGRVLIVGGTDGVQRFYECLVFDPRNMTIKTAASLADARISHRLVRLPDGTVLIIAGGSSGATLLIESFNPATDTLRQAGNLLYPHVHPIVYLRPDGKVLIAGDMPSLSNYQRHVSEVFDPSSGISSDGPDMFWGRGNGLLVDLDNGKFITTGGNHIGGIELYDSMANRFSPVASTHQAPFVVTSSLRLSGSKVLFTILDIDAQTVHTEIMDVGSL
jgi:hypothetical protein